MRLPFGRIIAGVSLLALSSTASLADGCSDRSRQAFMVRSLQTELMVAALTCQIRPEYNAFVKRFKKHLALNGKALRKHYVKHYGDESEKRLNRYVTKLANKSSQQTINARGDYCDQARQLYEEVLVAEPELLVTLAASRPFADDNLPASCRADINVAVSG